MTMDRFKGKTILLVDDDGAYLTMLQVALSNEGAGVLLAENGEDGLRSALSEHPDLIVLDLIMPGMSGMEMLTKLREDEWGKDAKVLVLTSVEDKDQIRQAVDLHVIEYFIKSGHTMEELAEVIFNIFIKH